MSDFSENWREEKQSAWLYRVVAQAERDAGKRALFASLAQAAEAQSLIWEKEFQKARRAVPEFRPSQRARLVAYLIRSLGPRAARPVLVAMKVRGMSVYQTLSVHGGHAMPASVSEIGHRHKSVSEGGNLRAAVFGVNDGLVSNASLIMGVAGATQDARMILLTGVAGMLAGAFSMAAGEYVSMRSQRELYEYQIGLEREELEQYPLEEQEEIALIYEARGLPKAQADGVAAEIMKDPERALDTLAREELGLNPDELGSPWGAAASSFLAFGAGGVVPLVPFFFGGGPHLLTTVAAVTAAALFIVGALLSLFTGRNAWWSGTRMLLIGGAAGAMTFVIGRFLGTGMI